MSDGNFNRNLLPYNNYQSGLRAGMARMKSKTLEELQQILKEHTGLHLDEAQCTQIIAELHKRLS